MGFPLAIFSIRQSRKLLITILQQLQSTGNVVNPITKERPALHSLQIQNIGGSLGIILSAHALFDIIKP